MKKAFVILILSPLGLVAQSGGSFSFQSLNLVNNARTAALGGYSVSMADGDASLFSQNPALLDSVKSGDAVFMYNPFFLDINALTGQYVTEVGGMGTFGFGLTYINYGSFIQSDNTGAESGTFNAQDYVFTVGKASRIGSFVLGANLKFVHSGIAGYNADVMVIDFGGLYKPNPHFLAAMVISSIGVVLNDYSDGNATIPIEVLAGMTFQPEGMPIRFTLTGHNLSDKDSEFYTIDEKPNFIDQIFKRVSLGGEILFSKNFNFLMGYDHNRKRELTLDQTAGGAGFSYGFMIRMKKYQFRFSRATYQAAGGTSFISIQSNLKEFKKIF